MALNQHEPAEPKAAPGGRASDQFFIVGIGASAGGLEAVSALLKRATIDGAAFVVVQHMAPTQKSMLTELLGRASKLQVVTAENGALVKPHFVYVSPPNATLSMLNGSLHVLAPAAGMDRVHLPIDSFFTSLAQDRGAQAIGVVMSGTGTDGTIGLAAIKAAGGITFAQDPDTAKFDGMPRSALESGAADFSLSPEAIADEILNMSEHPYARPRAPVPEIEMHMGELSLLFKNSFGMDLAHYKRNTIERRLQRRMAVQHITSVADYLRLCQSDTKELAALHTDLLINVTAFFRDREPFDVLKKECLERLIEQKKDGETIRIWVPGCASGEEAYSIGICLLELLDESQRNIKVQLFGTDVDADAIQQARRGIYSPKIEADVSAERLRRFFIKTDDGSYQVSRRIRDISVFSTQNLCRDAPFSRLDLVSCRNVLIYLQPTIQRKVMRILHYALLPDGFLLLGTSESVGDSAELFSLIDRKNKLYSAKHVSLPRTALDVDVGGRPALPATVPAPFGTVRPVLSIAHLADRKILDEYAPPGVVVSENLDILYFRGRTTPYLEQPSGVATNGLLRLVRPELHQPLKKALEQTLKTGEITSVATQVKDGKAGFRPLTLVVQPLREPETKARCLLVLFQEPRVASAPVAVPPPATLPVEPESDERVRHMAQELTLTKDYLQSTIEEVERTNEDLKSANEELQSSNEELQSTNEELETSKEELQSTNEELITLNEELHNRMRDLSVSNDDLHNVLLGVDRPMVIVDLDLRIRRFTQSAEKILNMVPADIGRSIVQINSFLGGVGIEKTVSEAIANVTTVEQEVQAVNGRWYILRVAPYKTLDLTIRGATIILIDIEVTKRRSELVHAVDEYAAEFLAAIQHPLMILNGDLSVIWVNSMYYETLGVMREETLGATLASVSGGRWAHSALDKALEDSISAGRPFRRIELDIDVPGQGRTTVKIGGSRIRGVANQTPLVLLSIEGAFIERSRKD
jgi:two-component system, chemotaxis family, CheB/CheR fusion protein